MRLPSLCPILLLCCLLAFPGAGIAAAEESNPPPKNPQIDRLARQIEMQRGELNKVRAKEDRLRAEVVALEQDIEVRQERLDALEENLALQHDIFAGMEQELILARGAWQQARDHLERRLRVLYTRRGSPLLDMAFSAASPRDLLSFDQAYHNMLAHDQETLVSYRTAVAELEASRQALALERGILEEFLRQEQGQRKELERRRDDKEGLLADVQIQATQRQQALAEMEQAWRRLLASMEPPQAKRAAKNPLKNAPNILTLRGKLPSPLAGRLVKEKKERLEGDKSVATDAIVIAAAEGSPVRAVAAGTVLFAGYLQGYGNAVVLDHGHDINSVTGHLGQVKAQREAVVQAGEAIGTTSDIAALVSGGVAFELRQAGKALPPLDWLQPDAFNEKQ
ncbi:MAG: hypothetical protein BWK76_24495 [Desulfobulbaceae bacterium A2]|nr:MAG: hypothetical protein BWK76_24495 [Desulfobulbaceae bacterium A2]